MRHLVLLSTGLESQLVDAVDDFAQVVTGLDAVFSSPKISPILYSIVSGRFSRLLELFEIRPEFLIDEVV